MRSKIVFLILFLLLASSFGILAPLPRAHAFSGGAVCIQAALPSTTQPTSCPSTPPTITIPSTIKSTFALEVDVFNSSALNGFDVAVQSDPAVAKPLTANITGSIINNLPGSSGLLPLVNCVNNLGMTCVLGVDAVGVAHIAIASFGGLSNPPTTGRLMYINYNVTGTSVSSPVVYPSSATQCASSSSPNFCVTISGTTGASVPETIVTASVGNTVPVPSVTITGFTPIQPHVGDLVTFTATATGGTPPYAKYGWTFGDGATKFVTTGSNMVNHTYSSAATFQASVNVTDSIGTHSAQSPTVPVVVQDFSLTSTGPGAVILGKSINITIIVTSQGGFTQQVALTQTIKPQMANSTISLKPQTGTPSYNSTLNVKTGLLTVPGKYNITITGTSTSITHTLNITITVVLSDLPPIVRFTYSPSKPVATVPIIFNATSSVDPDGQITNYSWNFGDGTPIKSGATLSTVTHTYMNGTLTIYTVILIETDNAGLKSSISILIAVRPATPPIAIFTFSQVPYPIENAPVQFDATLSHDLESNGTIIRYSWSFGDATSGSGKTVTHSYAKFGNYTVTLIVTDNDNLNSAPYRQYVVVNALPTAGFTLSQTNPFVGETVTFTAVTTDPDSPPPPAGLNDMIVGYAWDFGDGSLPTLQTTAIATHVYTVVGSYDVFLIVTDKFGGVSLSKTTTVKVDEPGIQLVSSSLSANTTTIGKAITLTVNLLNNGTTSLSFRLDMTVNNITVAEQDITLQPGRNTSPAITLSWDTTGYKPGIFLVKIRLLGTTANGRLISLGQNLPAAGTVTLNTAPSQAFTLPGGNTLWIAIAVIVILGAALTFLLARRRRTAEA